MSFINECHFRAAAGGLGDFVVASAITGFFTPEQTTDPPIIDGIPYNWRAESDDFSQHELFRGVYDSATDTVARTIIRQSSNGGAKVNFSAAPRVRQVAISQDLYELIIISRTYFVRTDGNDANNGLLNTAGGAFLTIQHALNVAMSSIVTAPSVLQVTIEVAAGTYVEFLRVTNGLGQAAAFYGSILVKGAGSATTHIRPSGPIPVDASSVIAAAGQYNIAFCQIDINGADVTGTPPVTIGASLGAIIQFGTDSLGDVRIGSSFNYGVLLAYAQSQIAINQPTTFYGDVHPTNPSAFEAYIDSQLVFYSEVIFEDNPVYNTAFSAGGGSKVLMFGTVTGAFTANNFEAASSEASEFLDFSNSLNISNILVDSTSWYNGAQGVRTKAGAVVAGDLPGDAWQVIHDTSGGTYALYANIGGVLKSVALT